MGGSITIWPYRILYYLGPGIVCGGHIHVHVYMYHLQLHVHVCLPKYIPEEVGHDLRSRDSTC